MLGNIVLKYIANWSSTGASKRKLLILTYHRVLEETDTLVPGNPTKFEFSQQMDVLARFFNVIPLRDATEKLYNGTLPSRAVCITFDDGYLDNHDVALPILKELGLHATFFISTGYLNGGIMWNDGIIETIRLLNNNRLDLEHLNLGTYDVTTLEQKRSAVKSLISALKYTEPKKRQQTVSLIADHAGVKLPDRLMMTDEHVRGLYAAGMEIGGHTETHPILASIPYQSAITEIKSGKQKLESIIDDDITLFAYPNGKPSIDYNQESIMAVGEAGFSSAVSTAWGFADKSTDRYQLPRIAPWETGKFSFYNRMIKSYYSRNAEAIR